MRCEHEHDDGAYVLGALSSAERAAYEGHLATCSFCREAVAEIADLPGLLGRLDAADFAKLFDPTLSPPPPSTPPSVNRRVRKHARVLGAVLAGAVVTLILGVGLVFLPGDGHEQPRKGPTVAMTMVDNTIPISARVTLAGSNGGTKVDLTCSYDKNSTSVKSYMVRLMAYGSDGEAEQLGSWIAAPGREFTMTGVTHFAPGNLSRLELVRNDGSALLAYDVP